MWYCYISGGEMWQSAAFHRGSLAHPCINTLRPRQNGSHFAGDLFKCIFFGENICITIKISLKFVPKGPINNIPALFQTMAWRRPLSEPMMVSSLAHICVTRPQCVKKFWVCYTLIVQHSIEARTRWPPFCRHFQIHILEWKFLTFNQNFTKIYSVGSNLP